MPGMQQRLNQLTLRHQIGRQRGRPTLLVLLDDYRYQRRASLKGHVGAVFGICTLESALLASVGQDQTVRLWDIRRAELVKTLTGHAGPVRCVCEVGVAGSQLATGGADGTVRIWGNDGYVLHGHTDTVTGLCAIQLGQMTLLASVSADRTARIWDLRNRSCLMLIPVHQPARCCGYIDDALVVGLDTGLLVLDFPSR